MYIKLSETPKSRTINVLVRDQVFVDYAETGELVGVRIVEPVISIDLDKPVIQTEQNSGFSVKSGDVLPQNKGE